MKNLKFRSSGFESVPLFTVILIAAIGLARQAHAQDDPGDAFQNACNAKNGSLSGTPSSCQWNGTPKQITLYSTAEFTLTTDGKLDGCTGEVACDVKMMCISMTDDGKSVIETKTVRYAHNSATCPTAKCGDAQACADDEGSYSTSPPKRGSDNRVVPQTRGDDSSSRSRRVDPRTGSGVQ